MGLIAVKHVIKIFQKFIVFTGSIFDNYTTISEYNYLEETLA